MRPITDLQRRSPRSRSISRLHALRRPADGDRRARRRGSRPGEQDVVLLGATGTGKSATTAWLIEQAAAADAGDGAQQDARRPAGQRVPRAAAEQRGRVLRLLLRLLPARGVRPADRHLHREGLLDQRRGRAAAALGDQLAADPARRHRGRDGVLHLRPRHAAGVRRPHGPAARSATAIERDELLRRFVEMQYTRNDLAFTRGTFRVRGDTVEIFPVYEELADPDRDVRRRDRADLRPCTRSPARSSREEQRDVRLPGHALRRRPGADGARDPRHRDRAGGAGSPSWSGRASCSRRSGCGCAPRTTSR